VYICSALTRRVESLAPGLRALAALSNANNGSEAGPCALTGNNAPSNANDNYGAFLNYLHEIGMSLPKWGKISEDDSELGSILLRTAYLPGQNSRPEACIIYYTMNRICDKRENETLENVRKAYENYSSGKKKRHNIQRFEKHLDHQLLLVKEQIINEKWIPSQYVRKVIFEKKKRILGKAPIHDHVIEAAEILPYEKELYDYIAWESPAIRPHLGTHALMRFMRNDLYRSSQKEMMYNLSMDVHHYFPSMDHHILKVKLAKKIKDGKLLRFMYKVVDSYLQGVPLGIKITQLFGLIYLADFDRLALRFFGINKDPEKLLYWTRRYIDIKIATAKSPEDFLLLSKGAVYLSNRFRYFVNEGIKHYYRFVDNMIFFHEDKSVLSIIREISLMILSRDYHAIINKDYNIRPTWMGVRLCGYVFYHDRLLLGKENKKKLCRHVAHLKKCGLTEEQVRIRQASRFGYAKHANTINLIKKIGMEKSLGKIIKRHRIKVPFEDMDCDQKVKFSSICQYLHEEQTGWNKKIYLKDYKVGESKIEKKKVIVNVPDSAGNLHSVSKIVSGKVLVIRFKKILKTEEVIGEDGAVGEIYTFEKKRDKEGKPMLPDAEYYSYTGSKILIDQAENDFSKKDLPCPTIIKQFEGKNGQTFFKFT
jgi:hypothetical protein